MTNDLINRFIKKRGPLKAEEIIEAGYSYKEILELEAQGKISRFKNGYYTCPEVKVPEEELVFSLFPDGVFTMETALYYHGYLPQRPYYWSIAISKNASKSRFNMNYPLIHPFYTEPKVLASGVEKLDLEQGSISLYEKDRLICEILKYEDKMERDDFKLAILSYIRDESKDIAKFLAYAKERRVIEKARSVIGPWL